MTRRVAAIDCGTNSIRLLVADVDPERGTLTDVDRRMEIVRLGQGVDTSGRLAPEALDRTMHALSGYAAVITRLDASDVRMAATSAARDAANAGEFVRRVTAVLGAAPEVLSGDEEARLSFTGATAELDGVPSAEPAISGRGHRRRLYRVRPWRGGHGVGGRQRRHRVCPDDRAASAFRPAVAGTDRRGHGRYRRCRRAGGGHGRRRPGAHPRRPGRIRHHRGRHRAWTCPRYDSARLHHARIAAAEVHAVATRLLSLTRAERARIAVMHPGRVDVIGAGALILDRIMSLIGLAEVLVSEHDILDGIAWSLAAPQKAPGR